MSDSINIIPNEMPLNSSGSQHHNAPKANMASQNVSSEHSGLHVGEIVLGTVLERLDKDTVHISLPTGNFNAVISGNLEKGDSLFFKVQVAQPTLVLKIFEIVTKNKNGEIPLDNLLRILDLPNDDIFKILINNYKKIKNTINKEQILNILTAYRSLSDTIKKTKSLDNITSVLIEMQESGFPLKANLFEKLLPLFNEENQIKDSLTELNKLKSFLPYNIHKILENYFDYFTDKNTNFEKLMQFFSIESKDNQYSFFDALVLITKIEDKNNLNMVKARAYAKSLLSTIEAMHLWNAFALQNNSILHLLFPVVFEGLLNIARINVLKIEDERFDEKGMPISFTFQTNTEYLGTTKSDVTAQAKLIDLSFFSQDEKDKNILNKYKSELLNSFSKQNYIIQSVKFGIVSNINQSNSQSNTNIKVVV